jgi:hypothetical protein
VSLGSRQSVHEHVRRFRRLPTHETNFRGEEAILASDDNRQKRSHGTIATSQKAEFGD